MPLARALGSWDLSDIPTCRMPNASRMMPMARIRPKMNSLRLLTTSSGSSVAKATVVTEKISTNTQNTMNRRFALWNIFIDSFISFKDFIVLRMLEVDGFKERDSAEHGLSVDVGRIAAVLCQPDVLVLIEVELFIHDGGKTANEKQGVPVVEKPHLVGREQFAAGHLHVGRVASALALGLAVGAGVDGGFAEQL